jgi:hypothetical protein
MSTQSRTFQRRILEEARRDNYADLFWYVECSAAGRRVFPAAYPGRLVPVVPVAPDPALTEHWAHLLAELFKASNPALLCSPALTSVEALTTTGAAWYEFGEVICLDAICYVCGTVGRVAHTVAGDGWLCETCAAQWIPEGSQ